MLWLLLAVAYVAVGAGIALVAIFAWQVRDIPTGSGGRAIADWGLLGEIGQVLTPIGDSPGNVRVRGEIWRAIAVDGVHILAGVPVTVVDQCEPLCVVVMPGVREAASARRRDLPAGIARPAHEAS